MAQEENTEDQFVTFTCHNCKTPQDEEALYYCVICNKDILGDEMLIFCTQCGNLNHKRTKHTWDDNVQTVNGLSHKKSEIEHGKMVCC